MLPGGGPSRLGLAQVAAAERVFARGRASQGHRAAGFHPNDIRNVVGEDQGERANPTEQAT